MPKDSDDDSFQYEKKGKRKPSGEKGVRDVITVIDSGSLSFQDVTIRYGFSNGKLFLNSIDLLRAIYSKKPTRGAPSRFGPLIAKFETDSVMHFSSSNVLYLTGSQAMFILQCYNDNSRSVVIDNKVISSLYSAISSFVQTAVEKPTNEDKDVTLPAEAESESEPDTSSVSNPMHESDDEKTDNESDEESLLEPTVTRQDRIQFSEHLSFTFDHQTVKVGQHNKIYYFSALDYMKIVSGTTPSENALNGLCALVIDCANDPIMHYEFMDGVSLYLSASQVNHVTKIYAHNSSERAYKAHLHRLLDSIQEFIRPANKRSPSPPGEEMPVNKRLRELPDEALRLGDVNCLVCKDTKIQYGRTNDTWYFNSVDLLRSILGRQPNRGAPSLLAPLLVDFKDPLLHKAKTPMKLVYLTKEQAVYVIGKYIEKFAAENTPTSNLQALLEAIQGVSIPESPVASPKLESAHSIERLLNPPASSPGFPPTTKMTEHTPYATVPTLPPLINTIFPITPKPYLPPPIAFPSNYSLPFFAGGFQQRFPPFPLAAAAAASSNVVRIEDWESDEEIKEGDKVKVNTGSGVPQLATVVSLPSNVSNSFVVDVNGARLSVKRESIMTF